MIDPSHLFSYLYPVNSSLSRILKKSCECVQESLSMSLGFGQSAMVVEVTVSGLISALLYNSCTFQR